MGGFPEQIQQLEQLHEIVLRSASISKAGKLIC